MGTSLRAARTFSAREAEISLWLKPFWLKPVFYWLFSVAGASFGLETFESGALTFLWTWPGNP